MQYKKMGRTGLKISEITLGTMIFGQQVDEDESLKIMDLAFEKGINSFDTADGYAGGRSEEIVGKALKNKRHSVVLASKVASKQGPGLNDSGLSREHILQAVENSLRRLGTDYLDIYYAHHPDPLPPSRKRCGRSIPWCSRARCAMPPAPITAPGSWCGRWLSANSVIWHGSTASRRCITSSPAISKPNSCRPVPTKASGWWSIIPGCRTAHRQA